MTSRDFCFWLQGYFEIGTGGPRAPEPATDPRDVLSKDQVDVIKKHLALVFKHEIDPNMGSESHQIELNDIHHPFKPEGKTDVLMRC
jgi:hypothetical protein